MPSKLVYLAGAITGKSFGNATNWRDWAISELKSDGITGLSPLRCKDYLLNETSLADTYGDLNILSSGKGITTRDRWDCMRADALLVNLLDTDRVSIGTVMELGWADAARNPIVLVMESGNLHDHAMVREVSGFIASSLEEGLAVVKALLV